MTHLRCAWLSQHQPTPSQRLSLAAYTISQVDPPGRCWSAADAWRSCCLAVGGYPDVVMLIIYKSWIAPFLWKAHKMNPTTEMIKPVMVAEEWAGVWVQLRWDMRRREVVKRAWWPEGVTP